MANGTKSFAELIEEAQKPPQGVGAIPPEVTSPFGSPLPTDHRVVDEVSPGKVPNAVEYDYKAHVAVLCLNKDEERDAYTDIVNKVCAGEALLRFEDRNMTKEGDSMVTISWLTKIERAGKKKSSYRLDNDD